MLFPQRVYKVPAVSVLMPSFNAGTFLRVAVESVLLQSFTDLELIIVDDGSTDDSFEALDGLNDGRIRVVRNKQNLGLVESRNIALAHAQAPLIACLDADDIALPTRLEKQVARFEADPNLALLGSQAYLVDAQGKPFGVVDVPSSSQEIRRTILRHNNIVQSSVMARRSVLNAVGGYPRDFSLAEDYALWLRVIMDYKVMNLAERLVCYRIHERQVSIQKLQKMVQTVRTIQSQAWLEFHMSGKIGGVLPPLVPDVWARLRGVEGSFAHECLFWARLYKQMGNWQGARGILATGLLSAPLCLDLYAAALPTRAYEIFKNLLRRPK